MRSRRNAKEARSNEGSAAPSLELHLSHSAFVAGRRLSGVVIFRLAKPANMRSLSVSIDGREAPSGAAISRALRGNGSFFRREVLLSGMEQPRLTSDRISRFWNAFLGRDTGRTLSAGEHVYPFSIALPASLPPSYRGRAGRIVYTAGAAAQFATGRTLKAAHEAPIVSVPRAGRAQPVALSYPTAGGNVHTADVSASLELPDRAVPLGTKIAGRFAVANPKRAEIKQVTVSLETCEWVRLATRKELERQTLDEWIMKPEDPTAPAIEAEFELATPGGASPTVEGTAISVIWLLKLSIRADPPIELRTPITVFTPVPEQ